MTIIALCLLTLAFPLRAFAGERLSYIAPSVLPATEFNMRTPGFWIARHPFPDRVILTGSEIVRLNKHIQEGLGLTRDIADYPAAVAGERPAAEIRKTLDYLSGRTFYSLAGRTVKQVLFEAFAGNINPAGIPLEVPVRFGLVTSNTDQRLLPTASGLYERWGNFDFDELQNSALAIGTAVAVLHETRDGHWYYVESPLSSGWVRAEHIALGSRSEIADFVHSDTFVVVTKAKGQIFLDSGFTRYGDYVRMGAKLPLLEFRGDRCFRIKIPGRTPEGLLVFRDGFLSAGDAHQGYLAYTPRNMTEQAFELLNAPYGWGGMYGEQDCSQFITEIFATAGIILPRNSGQQAGVGLPIDGFAGSNELPERLEALNKKAVGGITLLCMKGHIMLFLGTVNGQPYVIHEIWGYCQRTWHGDVVRVINRVVVTDLSLGRGTVRGTFLERLNAVRLIANQEIN